MGKSIPEQYLRKKIQKVIKLILLTFYVMGDWEKINVRLVKDTFKAPKKNINVKI